MNITLKKFPLEIILSLIISVFFLPLIIFDIKDIFRIFIGLPIIFFIPGYLLLYLLFPIEKKGVNLLERFILSIGFSICIISFIALILNYTNLGIEIKPVFSIIFLFIIVLSILSIFRWYKTNEYDRFSLFEKIFSFHSKSNKDFMFLAIVSILIVIILIVGIAVIVNIKPAEKFTSFYLLGETDNAANYIKNISAEEETVFTLGINNHEYKKVDYTIEIWLINQSLDYDDVSKSNKTIYRNMWFIEKRRVSLDHTPVDLEDSWEPQWQNNITISFDKKADNLKLAFLLFKTSTQNYIKNQDYSDIASEKLQDSYRDLYIWLNIV